MNDQTTPAPNSTADAAPWKTIVYPLTFPVGDLTALTFREPDGETLEAIEDIGLEDGKAPKIKQINALVSILSGVPIEAVRKMHQSDIKAASEAMVPLLDGAI
ncbi:phage tail assembly protein [Rhizobium ruizarguesonis]|uniref:phage tail assembly protein n=1 Tax=Rhizobium ruizarguesonis TaxID=2081791 RepID=UPI00103160BA|nr:phage tail assembly protein [Rhizobium ruizarguesonis]TBB53791.1 phage tail assembly protein [Rhizobium ruizarguesonis]